MFRIHPHSNKWLLYSSTVILLSFILLFDLGTVRVVNCESSEDSNDIGTMRHVDKIPGKAAGRHASSSSAGGNHHHHNHDSNEVHSPSLRFPTSSAGDEEDEDEDDYFDEDASYDDEDHFADSDEFKHDDVADVEYIESYENRHRLPEKPRIAKCCQEGEGISADGKCKQIRNSHNQK
ncbi:unnamed protein product [Orchesella dallaii]|uniref:Uncharacterized protein n=1 Tax=Orchesella dallaii TaxID=48710 RepID=A0ABP1S6D1_9HEXA